MENSILRQRTIEMLKKMWRGDSDELEQFCANIQKLPLELVRQFAGRFSDYNKMYEAIELDILTVVSQHQE